MSFRVQVEGVPSDETLRRLLEEARAQGASEVVVETSHEAGEAWIRAGFREASRVLAAPVETLERLLAAARGPSFGSIHVQTDDVDAVVHAVRQYVPRLPGGSRGSVVLPPRDGWTSIYDELCDREPEMLRRLGVELSNRSGSPVLTLGVEEGRVVRYIALDRGRVVDEYLSVPEYYGPVPPGEVIALGANARLMARLTGADPARVRDVAVTAAGPEGHRPASELVAELGRLFGVRGAEHGYEVARSEPGAIELPRA
jgi:hypothetical protein